MHHLPTKSGAETKFLGKMPRSGLYIFFDYRIYKLKYYVKALAFLYGSLLDMSVEDQAPTPRYRPPLPAHQDT
jgi:hypothetical protein